jgi:hypothetical protein
VKISYIPARREIPPGHIEIGSQIPARKAYSEIRMVTYYRYFWFQPNGIVRHTCVPDPPDVVRRNPGGLWPLSNSKRCLGRVVNIGSYGVRQKNVIDITIPNIGPETDIVVQLRIAYPKGQYGKPPLKPLPPRGSFFVLMPVFFNLEAAAWNGEIRKTPMPITFGELFHFSKCGGQNQNEKKMKKNEKTMIGNGVGVESGAGVLLSSEEEKAAAKEASLT